MSNAQSAGPSADPESSDAPEGAPTPSPSWDPISVPAVAERLGLVVTKVHQLIRERTLLAVRVDGVLSVPAGSVVDGVVVKGLPGTITLLSDAGFSDEEIIGWLHTPDESLPGRPIDALRENRGREVHRRAQAAGF
ncbi:Rv2175c family DNA-binding protein [Nakamurella leprariae]|uniref:DNA-binding protein n=1 Tax=Nakamurella leprariae TaxID=2803911 RepID=A0A938Y6X5_9ACTN|nr:Rv2175c family DNA-binding protein [Nakamurella leprariae]MBM9466920.1 DNA-binding protein [Nakamurella leprariae]